MLAETKLCLNFIRKATIALLAATMFTPALVQGGIEPLSIQEFQAELNRLTREIEARRGETDSSLSYWALHTQKLKSLIASGHSNQTELDEAAIRLTTFQQRLAALEAFTRVLRKAQDLSLRMENGTGSPPAYTVVRIPGATQRYGGIELFTLPAPVGPNTPTARQKQWEARELILESQKIAASAVTAHFATLAGKLEALHEVSDMELARMEMRLGKASAIEEQAAQDLFSNAKTDREIPESTFADWCDEPPGLAGSGWRYAAPPTLEMIRLCLPVAHAQRNAFGRAAYLEVLLEELDLKLELLKSIQGRGVTNEPEIRRVKMDRERMVHTLAAERQRLKVAELRFQKLLRAAKVDDYVAPDLGPFSLQDATREAEVALDSMPAEGAWLYGVLRITQNRLTAIARQRAAQQKVECKSQLEERFKKVATVREIELRRADFSRRKSEALLAIAREDRELSRLTFHQWVALARASKAQSGYDHLWIDGQWLRDGREILEARISRHLQTLAAAESELTYQEEKLRLLRQIQDTAASEYEIGFEELKLKQLEGEVAAEQHRIALLQQAANFLSAGNEDLKNHPSLTSLMDFSASSRRQLMELAAEMEGPNMGTVFRLKATLGLTTMRKSKFEELLPQGFASPREIANVNAEHAFLNGLVAAETGKSRASLASREMIASLLEPALPASNSFIEMELR